MEAQCFYESEFLAYEGGATIERPGVGPVWPRGYVQPLPHFGQGTPKCTSRGSPIYRVTKANEIPAVWQQTGAREGYT